MTYIIIGSYCVFFQEETISRLEAQFSDKEVWTNNYGDRDFDEIKTMTQLFLSIAGYSAYMMSIVILFLCKYTLYLSAEYDKIQSANQVINLIYAFLGLLIIFIAE